MPISHYGQPRYRVIAEELRNRIESGAIPLGTLIPSESSLMAEFRVSRGTIRRAIEVIRLLGLVTTEQGRGTCTRPQLTPCETDPIETQADAELASLFKIEVGAKLIRYERAHVIDNSVQSVTRTYFRPPS